MCDQIPPAPYIPMLKVAASNSKWDERFLDLAAQVATWSKDPGHNVGAIVVNSDRQILATGYNGFPRGFADTEERLNTRDVKLDYVVHAEMNAICSATYNGMSLRDSTIYVYGLPVCVRCAAHIVQAGIKEVVLDKEVTEQIFVAARVNESEAHWLESWEKTKTLFTECGIYIRFV